MKKTCGVYKLTNIKTGDFYIGSSKHLEQRRTKHFSQIRAKKHQNPNISQQLSSHCEADFKFEILERCHPYELKKREQFNIEKLKPQYNKVAACDHTNRIKRLNVEIPIELFNFINKQSFKRNVTITKYVIDMIVEQIKKNKKRRV